MSLFTKRFYTYNGQYVSAEVFAEVLADLFAAGWTLAPPKDKP